MNNFCDLSKFHFHNWNNASHDVLFLFSVPFLLKLFCNHFEYVPIKSFYHWKLVSLPTNSCELRELSFLVKETYIK